MRAALSMTTRRSRFGRAAPLLLLLALAAGAATAAATKLSVVPADGPAEHHRAARALRQAAGQPQWARDSGKNCCPNSRCSFTSLTGSGGSCSPVHILQSFWLHTFHTATASMLMPAYLPSVVS